MLRVLGVTYYILAGLCVFAMVDKLVSGGAAWEYGFVVAFAGALSTAFFGAMCFVADDCRTVLLRIAGIEPLNPVFGWSRSAYPAEQIETGPETEQEATNVQSRTCPQCGKRYPGNIAHCIVDGVALN